MTGTIGVESRASTMTRERMASLADGWSSAASFLVVMAGIGSVLVAIAVAPQKVEQGLFSNTTETDVVASIGIGVGTFVSSLVVILPYFMIVHLIRGMAVSLPPEDLVSVGTVEAAASSREGEDPSDEYEGLVQEFPEQYEIALDAMNALQQAPLNPRRWLRELCRRVEAGSPVDAAAQRIPLDL